MKHITVKSFGPIQDADISFGDLTLLVGPQASGKSIFIQLVKLLTDKNHIRKTVEQYSFIWEKQPDKLLDLYFGAGMNGIWNEHTEVSVDNKSISRDFIVGKNNEPYRKAEEKLFYIPAQRILSVSEGRAKAYTEFDGSFPFVLRYFSETLRQLLQNDFAVDNSSVFPKNQRLKSPLRTSFNNSVFHGGKVVMENIAGQRKFKMNVDDMSIPFMTWSAGQKEFMPLLLSFYWLCPPSKISTRNSIHTVVIEEPEMGLHPQAIQSVILQVIDLLSRGYKVIISTHSPVFLEFAWAFNLLKKSANEQALIQLFGLTKTTEIKKLFKGIYDKEIKTYYFDRESTNVTVKDISSLDAGDENSGISGWGGISEFSGKTVDILSMYLKDDE